MNLLSIHKPKYNTKSKCRILKNSGRNSLDNYRAIDPQDFISFECSCFWNLEFCLKFVPGHFLTWTLFKIQFICNLLLIQILRTVKCWIYKCKRCITKVQGWKKSKSDPWFLAIIHCCRVTNKLFKTNFSSECPCFSHDCWWFPHDFSILRLMKLEHVRSELARKISYSIFKHNKLQFKGDIVCSEGSADLNTQGINWISIFGASVPFKSCLNLKIWYFEHLILLSSQDKISIMWKILLTDWIENARTQYISDEHQTGIFTYEYYVNGTAPDQERIRTTKAHYRWLLLQRIMKIMKNIFKIKKP